MKHLCHAVDCSKSIAPKYLFCGPHWAMVPSGLRQLVWQTYRPGQEVDKQPSLEYLIVQRLVVASVARTCGNETEAQRLEEIAAANLVEWGAPGISLEDAKRGVADLTKMVPLFAVLTRAGTPS